VKVSGKLSYFFRKYPIVRFFSILIVIGIIFVSFVIFDRKNKVVPYIESIVPSVGMPGDVVLINGKNFGNARDISFVEFSGNKLTASSYISWSDNCIKLVLPANVQDGLVVVGVNGELSNATLFANAVDIPVPVEKSVMSTKPTITSVGVEKARIGDLISINGNNFGESRNNSKVLFTIDYDKNIEENDLKSITSLTEDMVVCQDDMYDFWSNNEIKVRVPDGACSGVIVVEVGEEKSEPVNFVVDSSVGKKRFSNKKIYLLQYSADVADVVTTDVSTITFRCPIPCTMASQPTVEITETVPEPILTNYQNNLIHQITKSMNNTPKTVFKQTFVLPVYKVDSSVNVAKVVALKKDDVERFASYLRPDEIIPCDDERVVALGKEIVKKEKNVYKQAKLVYEYMCENFKILNTIRKAESNPLDMFSDKFGDAYDFSVMYCAIMRSLGIPCVTDSGILVGKNMETRAHWWNEIYINGLGWIFVDVALGAGLEYEKWLDDAEDNMFYFGNMDNHHICFSRGWTQLKPFSKDNKIVQHPRSFALQSIWEEASEETAKYSSFWSVPVVKGVY
jgi:hypothetical protein